MRLPQDRNGIPIRVGARVHLLGLSGNWINELPREEQHDVFAMIGQIFEIEEIDKCGLPWITMYGSSRAEGEFGSHSIALEGQEIEIVFGQAL